MSVLLELRTDGIGQPSKLNVRIAADEFRYIGVGALPGTDLCDRMFIGSMRRTGLLVVLSAAGNRPCTHQILCAEEGRDEVVIPGFTLVQPEATGILTARVVIDGADSEDPTWCLKDWDK